MSKIFWPVVIITVSLLVLNNQPAVAAAPSVTPGCLYVVTLQPSPCRRPLLQQFVKQHLRWDTRRWAMPLYLELDEQERWQRLSIFCLHLSRRPQ